MLKLTAADRLVIDILTTGAVLPNATLSGNVNMNELPTSSEALKEFQQSDVATVTDESNCQNYSLSRKVKKKKNFTDSNSELNEQLLRIKIYKQKLEVYKLEKELGIPHSDIIADLNL